MQKAKSMSRAAVIAVLSIGLAAFLACAGPYGGAPNQSPAPAFSYITDEQLESAMWQLADGVRNLQTLFASRKPLDQSQRVEVIDILDRMIAAADELGPDGVSTNHPRITHNLTRFREKLEIARSSASMNPPRYYLVGNLSGICLACHGKN